MILVTGGAGYTGSVLVSKLLEKGHQVRIVDAMWFGNHLPPHGNLDIKIKTYDQVNSQDLAGVETVIHLANIANDPSVELAPVLSWEVNVLNTKMLLDHCRKAGIKRFIYASSGSVYGLKSEPNVTEDLDLVPISVYNKTKMVAERVVTSYQKYFNTYNIRPATVCGYSPRMRFDVVVNMFIKQALLDNKIIVFGGEQIRPNIHVLDLASIYCHLTENDIAPGDYNAGFENISVLDIAKKVLEITGCELEIRKESNDPRSYRQDSSKLISTGFNPKHDVTYAINELTHAFRTGKLVDDPKWYTVSWMREIGIGE
jgi:nucleoside-diphosphate-sugar epimerase